jgi:Ferritin-like domain
MDDQTCQPTPSLKRRNFFTRASLVAGAVAIGVSGKNAFGQTASPTLSDADLLNFLLNNEYLVAEFYLRAFYGQELPNADTTGSGTPGPVRVNGNQVRFRNPFIYFIARQLAIDELAHVRALRTVIPELGGAPVARPTIDLDGAWQAFASGAGLRRPFRPLESETDFLLASFYFEENDVAAVRGVLALLQSGTVRDAITGALGTEGYHGGFLRLAIHEIGLVERRVLQDAEQIQIYRNQLIANPADAVPGLFDQSGNALLAPVNALGQTPSQTAREHLNLLYLNRNVAAGGFFPNGLNGAIR